MGEKGNFSTGSLYLDTTWLAKLNRDYGPRKAGNSNMPGDFFSELVLKSDFSLRTVHGYINLEHCSINDQETEARRH